MKVFARPLNERRLVLIADSRGSIGREEWAFIQEHSA
jgi:hypothetical protein